RRHLRDRWCRRGRSAAHLAVRREPVARPGLRAGDDHSRPFRGSAHLCAPWPGRLADGLAAGARQHCTGAARRPARLSAARGASEAYICLYAVGDHGSVVAQPPMTAFPSFLRMGAQAFLRDWRAGELRLLLLALVIAVAAITSVGFLADRAARVLERDAAQML